MSDDPEPAPRRTSARYLSTGQAARYLGLSVWTVRRYEAAGLLSPYRTPGGRRRFLRTELDAFIERQRDQHWRRQYLST